MHVCPACGSQRLHRSRTRRLEKIFKLFTRKRPYACGGCGWRGWREPGTYKLAAPGQPTPGGAPPDPEGAAKNAKRDVDRAPRETSQNPSGAARAGRAQPAEPVPAPGRCEPDPAIDQAAQRVTDHKPASAGPGQGRPASAEPDQGRPAPAEPDQGRPAPAEPDQERHRAEPGRAQEADAPRRPRTWKVWRKASAGGSKPAPGNAVEKIAFAIFLAVLFLIVVAAALVVRAGNPAVFPLP